MNQQECARIRAALQEKQPVYWNDDRNGPARVVGYSPAFRENRDDPNEVPEAVFALEAGRGCVSVACAEFGDFVVMRPLALESSLIYQAVAETGDVEEDEQHKNLWMDVTKEEYDSLRENFKTQMRYRVVEFVRNE